MFDIIRSFHGELVSKQLSVYTSSRNRVTIDSYVENNVSKMTCTYVNAALPSSMSLLLAPGPAFPQKLTAMHMRSPHLLRK